MILAQAGVAWSIGQLMIVIIVVAAVIGIAMIAVRASGIAIPSWVTQIVWIVIVVFVAVLAIKFLIGNM
jgi:hypothetical protein